MLNESISCWAFELLGDEEKEYLISIYSLEYTNGMAEDLRTVVQYSLNFAE